MYSLASADCKTDFSLTICLPEASADNFYKQFGPRSGPTNMGPDLDPNCLTLCLFFEKVDF